MAGSHHDDAIEFQPDQLFETTGSNWPRILISRVRANQGTQTTNVARLCLTDETVHLCAKHVGIVRVKTTRHGRFSYTLRHCLRR